ncbi:hypothetical protein RU97_GL001878 [Enterococcus canis]|uniref:Uncharacterized protein n=1 Tax=Enterococcus canis TaxID=214095 RepID=A0A1L8RFC1_9ENTE|nr:hypothetical protein [Enterococcus canis]OJG18481.1 hypothetical protein RU97_GL001878 [Enterococcus canis]
MTDFEEKLKALRARYDQMDPETRRRLLQKVQQDRWLSFRSERLKQELLRLEAKRAQLSFGADEKQMRQIEARILQKKEQFFQMLSHIDRGD